LLTFLVLGFLAQAFTKWRAQPHCDRDWKDAELTNTLIGHASG